MLVHIFPGKEDCGGDDQAYFKCIFQKITFFLLAYFFTGFQKVCSSKHLLSVSKELLKKMLGAVLTLETTEDFTSS